MAKITVPAVSGGFNLQTDVNTRLQQIEAELNNKVLYRANPVGEDNSLSNDIDMNSNDILNAKDVYILDSFGKAVSFNTTIDKIRELLAKNTSWNNRGVWTTATAYNVNDIWSYGALWYIVTTAYTSGVDAPTDIGGANVSLLTSSIGTDSDQIPLNADIIYPVNTVAELRSLTGVSAGQRVSWLGYYAASDGGSNWGIVKSGAHTDDGLSIFSIDANTYVEANLKGKSVNPRKAGAKGDNSTDDFASINTATTYAESSGIKKLKWSAGQYRTSDTLTINHQTIWTGSGTSCQIIPLASMVNKPVITNTQVINGLWSGYFTIKDMAITNVEVTATTQGISLLGAVWEWELNNVQLTGFGLSAIKCDRSYRGRIINCGIYSCGLGGSEAPIYIMSSNPADRSSNIRISGGNVQDTPAGLYAVRIDGAVGCTVDMLTFQSNGRGISLEGTTNCAVRDCYMEDLDREINLIVGTNGNRNEGASFTNVLLARNVYTLPILIEGDEDTIFDNVRGVGSAVKYLVRQAGSRRSRLRNCKGLSYQDTNSYRNEITIVEDEFYGVALDVTHKWVKSAGGTAAIINSAGGRCRLDTTATINTPVSISAGIAPQTYANENPVVETVLTLNNVPNVIFRPIDMVNGANFIRFTASNGGGGGTNIALECSDGAGTASVLAALVVDAVSHSYRIEVMSDSVKGYIDGVLVSELTTFIPQGALSVSTFLQNTSASSAIMDITSFKATKDFTRV